MAANKPTIPKGTRDFGPAEVHKRKYILNTIESVFKKYGFMPIETPTMENLTTLEGKYGDEGDKLLFRVLNSGDAFKEIRDKNGDEKISNFEFRNSLISEKGLRYDLTVPFARYVVMNRNEITFPFKRYQMQPVWRADRPQRGRYREFWQCDADVVGSDSLLNEVDLIQMYIEVFNKLGIRVKVKINHRKLLEGIANYFNCLDRFTEFTVIIDKIDKIGYSGVTEEFRNNGFVNEQNQQYLESIELAYFKEGIQQNYDKWVDQLERIEELFRDKGNALSNGILGVNELTKVLKCFDGSHSSEIEIDVYLARGLSYYTGAIFEVVVNDERCSLKSSIGGGGRYDNLTGIFGLPNVSGVGISFGLDRIYDVMEELKLFPNGINATSTNVLICAFDEQSQHQGLQIVSQLRNAGIASELYPDLPKSSKEKEKPMLKPMNYADALHIPYAIILKSDGSMVFKNMTDKTESSLSIAEIITHLTN